MMKSQNNTSPQPLHDSSPEVSGPERCSRRQFLGAASLATAGAALTTVPYHATAHSQARTVARGKVLAGDPATQAAGQAPEKLPGSRSGGKQGLADVLVSNGRQVTRTDEQGAWELELHDSDDALFVIKPRDWMVPVNAHQLPQHSRLHLPGGSPSLKYGGIAPTGPLPDSIDFVLHPQAEPDTFQALMCGDPQPRDLREIDYLSRTVVPHLRNTRAAFGVNLGDIMFDNLSLYGALNQAYGLIGIPWFSVLGNHDLDYDAPTNARAHDTFKQHYGAAYYAFNWGPAHFIVLDNVEWMPADPKNPQSRGAYRGFLGERQLEFVRNDLAQLDREQLIVVAMHIPLKPPLPADEIDPSSHTVDADELLKLLSPFAHTLSFSAHYHVHAHLFLDSKYGWTGPGTHHHIITGTQCGSWFRGAPDANEIPHGTMSDGTPRGYLELEVSGNRATVDGYRVFGQPAQTQMRIDVPNGLPVEEIRGRAFYANVYNGTDRSRVRFRIAGVQDTWQPMQRSLEPDPAYVRLQERDKTMEKPFFPLPAPSPCTHLWKAELPQGLQAGTYQIEVAETDMNGNVHHGSIPFRVT
jgi:hypothetical protein